MAAIDARNWLLVEPTVTCSDSMPLGEERSNANGSMQFPSASNMASVSVKGCVMSCPGQVSAGALGSSRSSSPRFSVPSTTNLLSWRMLLSTLTEKRMLPLSA